MTEGTHSVSLGKRVRSGAGWNAGSSLMTQVLAIVRSVIIARLLTPEDFGLFGMVMTVVGAAGALTSFGFDMSVIVKRQEDNSELRRALNTAWTAELVRRLLISIALLLVVYPVARFYQEPLLLQIMPVIAITPFIQGFQNIGLVLWRKGLNFKPLIVYEQVSSIITTAVAIVFALVLRNYWALVLIQLIGAVISVVLSYIFNSYRPRLQLDRRLLSESLSFGKHLFFISVMTYATTTADNVMVGRLVGPAELGSYQLVYGVAVGIPIAILMSVTTSVMIPAYAELRDGSAQAIGSVVNRVLAVGAALLTLMLLPLGLFAAEFVSVVYGAQWLAAIPLLQVLVLLGFVRGLTNLLSPVSIGMEHPEMEAKAKTAEGVLYLAVLYVLITRYGAIGAAWAGVIIYSVAFVIRVHFATRLVDKTMLHIFRTLLVALSAAVFGAVVGLALTSLLDSAFLRLFVGTLLSTGAAFVVFVLLLPPVRQEFTRARAFMRSTIGA